MDIIFFAEWIAVLCNLAFIILIIRQKASGWLFGVLGSVISIYVFYKVGYYSESFLYLFYVLIGVYGYLKWHTSEDKRLAVTEWSWQRHVPYWIAGLFFFVIAGNLLHRYSDAEKPYADAFSTVFSFIATYLEAKKILSAWIYWIVLNLYSIWLYGSKELYVYALLMAVYTALSFRGYQVWKNDYLLSRTA
jgi:nicotinamide mononucleotide transporter